jgi:exopolysaccharide biosynthesis polyprenyl glycosylphosphotransferase
MHWGGDVDAGIGDFMHTEGNGALSRGFESMGAATRVIAPITEKPKTTLPGLRQTTVLREAGTVPGSDRPRSSGRRVSRIGMDRARRDRHRAEQAPNRLARALADRWAEPVGSALSGLAAATLLADFSATVAAVVLAWAAAAYHGGASDTKPGVVALGRAAVLAMGCVALAVAAGLLDPSSVSGAAIALLAAASTGAALRVIRGRRRRPVRTLLVGDLDGVRELASRWALDPGLEILGGCVIDDALGVEEQETWIEGVRAFRSPRSVADAAQRVGAEQIVVVPGADLTNVDVRRLAWALEDTGVQLGVVGVLDRMSPHRVSTSFVGRRLVLNVRPSRRPLYTRGLRWLADRVGGSLLLLAVSPLLLLLAVAIRLDSSGPAFFKQKRVGMHGRTFTMFKLRTMQVDAPLVQSSLTATAGNQMLFKMEHDPRVTRVGRFLRRSSLDEVPQLINVVRGEMSLIGPRPALPTEVARYDDDARRRLAVKPGLTGLWQVSGRSTLSWEESLDLDLHYVDNARLTDDVVIMGRTVGAVLGSRGAY